MLILVKTDDVRSERKAKPRHGRLRPAPKSKHCIAVVLTSDLTFPCLAFFFSDTFHHVRETANKLQIMNKKMIDLSKAGEATEGLEQYVQLYRPF